MSDKPTPETDAVMTDKMRDGNDLPDLARRLERERDELRAEVERLSHEIREMTARNGATYNRNVEANKKNASLLAEVERLKADGKRLDWMEELDPDSRAWVKIADAICILEAIDAAMKGELK